MSQLTNESGTHRCGTGVYEDQILDGFTHMKINPSWNIRIVDVPVCVSDNDDDYSIQDCDIENSHEDQSQLEYQGR